MNTSIIRGFVTAAGFIALVASAGATTKGPGAGGYVGTDEVVASFIDLSVGGGTSILAGVDDGMTPLALPFTVPFFGADYTMACVSTNGAIYLVSAAAECSGFVDFANTGLNATPPAALGALLPLWSDLTFEMPGAGAVLYGTVEGQDSRRFVIQWHNAYPVGSPGPVTFQVVLTEGTGKILFQYKTVDLGDSNTATRGAQATVGIRNAGPGELEWSVNAPVIADGSAILFTTETGDTTPPVLDLPDPIVVRATGVTTVVSYTATALDNVDGEIVPVCAPASGFAFAIGTHTVSCTATDAAGNSSAPGTFTITVNDITTPGEMTGQGFVRDDGAKYMFAFSARERASGSERARVSLRIDADGKKKDDKKGKKDSNGQKGHDRDDRFESRTVAFMAFSDDPSVRPGRPRRPQIDTVLFSGVGEWNGTTGYRYEVFAQDSGEGRRHRESIRMTVWSPSGTVVASFEGEVEGGNIQSSRIRHEGR